MIKKNTSKEIILSLIKDDLTNLRLVHGLNIMGLKADNYHLYLSDTIVKILGFNFEGQAMDNLMDNYFEQSKEVYQIDIHQNQKELNDLSLKLYKYLLTVRRSTEIVR